MMYLKRVAGSMVSSSLALLMTLTVGGCGNEQVDVVEDVARPVRVLTIGSSAHGNLRVYPGKAEASDTAMLAFQHDGKVIELPVIPGQRVKKGEVLAKIDPHDFEQAVSAAEARYTEIQRNVERYKTLHQKELVATADLQAKEKDAEVAKSQLENAKKNLLDTALVAPFDGIVSQKLIENFQNVKSGEVVIRVQTIDKIKITIYMPESDISLAPKGARDTMKAAAVFSAVPDREFALKVFEVETEADPKTNTYQVKLIMDQPEGVNILPGMTAQVRLDLSGPDGQAQSVFIVPAYAIFSDAKGKPCVWVMDHASLTVYKREVTVGKATGTDQIQVTSGIQQGETIVTTGVNQLFEGTKVRPIVKKIGD
jgi:RND family efflux transporter MFP subunit